MIDPDAFRGESRRRWEAAAPGWEERREVFQRQARPVSIWLVEHVRPQPGHRILELAAGVGDTGLLAAELVAPGGVVVISDGAQAMVDAARRRGTELGVDNAEYLQMEAEWIDLPAASLDGVISRWGHMLLADPASAFRETRRVLKSGGRIALAAWAAPEDNLWMWAVTSSMVELGKAEPPPPGAPGPFAFAPEGRIAELLEGAGFDDVEVEALDFVMEHAGLDEHFEHQSALSVTLRESLAELTPAEHTALRDAIDAKLEPFVRDDGSVAIPARTWVAAAQA